ncbi:MAG: hypothetical protein ACOX1R_01330 [Caldicoprobacterales bacterium]
MKVARKKLGFVFLDLFCVNISLVLAFLIQNEGVIPQRYRVNLWLMMLIASVIAIGSFYIFQLYNSLWKYASLGEMFMIGFACLVSLWDDLS